LRFRLANAGTQFVPDQFREQRRPVLVSLGSSYEDKALVEVDILDA